MSIKSSIIANAYFMM